MKEVLPKEQVLEYQGVRERVGWYRLPSETAFEMSGKDSVSFLHGMVSNDVTSLQEGEGCYATCLTPTGKMISDLKIYALPDRLLVLLLAKKKKEILEYFDKFIFTEEVLFEDLEDKVELLSLQGPMSPQLFKEIVGTSLEGKPHCHEGFQVGEMSLRAFKVSHTGEDGFDFLILRKDGTTFHDLLKRKGRSYGLLEIHDEVLEILRIEAAIPRYGIEMDETTIPLEVGLEGAVSYTKGCYVGQEVIARIKHIGHVNRLLSGLKLPILVSRGDLVFQDGEEVGRVTSSCFAPAVSSHVALAMLRREAIKPDISLTVKTESGLKPAILFPLPFYVRT